MVLLACNIALACTRISCIVNTGKQYRCQAHLISTYFIVNKFMRTSKCGITIMCEYSCVSAHESLMHGAVLLLWFWDPSTIMLANF